MQSNSNGICRALSGPDDIRESYNEDLFKGGHTLFREEKSNLIILGKNRDRIDCFCRFDLTQVNTINFLKE